MIAQDVVNKNSFSIANFLEEEECKEFSENSKLREFQAHKYSLISLQFIDIGEEKKYFFILTFLVFSPVPKISTSRYGPVRAIS